MMGGFGMSGFGCQVVEICDSCMGSVPEIGTKCVNCGSIPEVRKSVYVEKVMSYLSQYRSSCMNGDRDIAWLALSKANVLIDRLNKLETNFQINKVLYKED